jgi:hypothetical protein
MADSLDSPPLKAAGAALQRLYMEDPRREPADRDMMLVADTLAALLRRADAAFYTGFIAGAGGTPQGHSSDFGDGGWDALTVHARTHARRYATETLEQRGALAESGGA